MNLQLLNSQRKQLFTSSVKMWTNLEFSRLECPIYRQPDLKIHLDQESRHLLIIRHYHAMWDLSREPKNELQSTWTTHELRNPPKSTPDLKSEKYMQFRRRGYLTSVASPNLYACIQIHLHNYSVPHVMEETKDGTTSCYISWHQGICKLDLT